MIGQFMAVLGTTFLRWYLIPHIAFSRIIDGIGSGMRQACVMSSMVMFARQGYADYGESAMYASLAAGGYYDTSPAAIQVSNQRIYHVQLFGSIKFTTEQMFRLPFG